MEQGKKVRLILFTAQLIVMLLVSLIMIFLGVYKKDNTFFYTLIPILGLNSLSAFVYFNDNRKTKK